MINKSELIKTLENNYFVFEYGEKQLFNEILDLVDDYYYNGTSSNKVGYYWYTLTIDDEEYDVWCK